MDKKLYFPNKNEIKREDPFSTLSYLFDSYNDHYKNIRLDLDFIDILENPIIFKIAKADPIFCVNTLLNKGVKFI